MKLINIFGTLILAILAQLSYSLEKGKETIAACVDDCKFLEKVLAIFPLSSDRDSDPNLNMFNYKYLFVYTDHLTVFKDDGQTPPIKGEKLQPSQSDFLNNFPLQSILTPCKNGLALCSIQEMNDQVMKKRNLTFKTPPKIEEKMGDESKDLCLVLLQDMNGKPEEMFIVCSKNAEVISRLKGLLGGLIQNQDLEENVGKAFMINKERNDMLELYLHINSKLFLGNNKQDKIEDAINIPGYEETFKNNLASDFSSPASYVWYKKPVDIPWTGKAEKKPEKERCFATVLKKENSKEVDEDYFCIYSSTQGEEQVTLKPEKASLVAEEWVIKINRQTTKYKREAAKLAASKMTGEVDPNDVRLTELKKILHDYAVELDKNCQLEKKTQAVCDEEKEGLIANKIEELCSGDKPCMKALADAIAKGLVPLSDKGVKNAWSEENPYRGADDNNSDAEKEANKKGREVLRQENGEADLTGLKGSYAEEAKKAMQELGIKAQKLDKDFYKKNGKNSPSKEEVMTAANTFANVLQGKTVDKLDSLGKSCVKKINEKFPSVTRAIGVVPFLSKFDPWLEYLGHIRDVQSEPKS